MLATRSSNNYYYLFYNAIRAYYAQCLERTVYILCNIIHTLVRARTMQRVRAMRTNKPRTNMHS